MEAAVAQIAKEEIRHAVVGDEDVYQAVVIEVQRHDSKRLGVGIIDAGFLAHVCERAVTVVSIEDTPRRTEESRVTGIAFAASGTDAGRIMGQVDIGVAANKEIEEAVVVVIEKSSAGAEIEA